MILAELVFLFSLVLNIAGDSYVIDHGLSRMDCEDARVYVLDKSGILPTCELETGSFAKQPGSDGNRPFYLSIDKFGPATKSKKKKTAPGQFDD